MTIEAKPVINIDLPNEYAYFSNPESFDVKNLDSLREHEYFKDIYKNLWSKLTMSYDRPLQESLISNLKGNLRQSPSYIVNPNIHKSHIATYWSELISNSAFPTYKKLEQEFRDKESDFSRYQLEILPWIKIDVMKSGASDEEIEYCHGLQMLISARSQAIKPLHEEVVLKVKIDKSKTVLSQVETEDKLRLIGTKTIPYFIIAERINKALKKRETALFGNNEIAKQLWKTAIYLKTSVLPYNTDKSFVRQTLLSYLVNKDYSNASLFVAQISKMFPGITPKFVDQSLEIDTKSIFGNIPDESLN